jgi:hypothetical protein
MSLGPLYESYKTNTFWWQTAGFSSGKEGNTYCYQCVSKSENIFQIYFQILKNQQGITRESAISIADVQKGICDWLSEREVLFRTPRNREEKTDFTETICGKLW